VSTEIPSFETIRYAVEGHVATLTLARPDRLNSFTPQMWNEMRALGRALVADPGDVRVLVVRGEGRAFSSGIDTTVFADPTGLAGLTDVVDHPDREVATVLTAQESYVWLAEAPFLTIAAVHGYAFGAGLQLALACDLRVMAEGTSVGLLEHTYGIIPDLTGTQFLPRLVGTGKALELIVTAAKIDAAEAYRIGIAERLVAPDALDAEVAALAAQVAAQPPLAVRGAKRAVRAALDGRSVRDGLLVEAEGQAPCLRSDDFREAITAFVEGRPPVYQGR